MVERKYLAHYIDAGFNASGGAAQYVRLGKDLEEYAEELNPDVETAKNILGEQSVKVSGYEAQADVDPFYYEDYDDSLSNKIMELANARATGDRCRTTVVDVLLKPDETDPENNPPTVIWAYREDAFVVPNSVGGDTTGIQTPFTIYKAGNRTRGTFDLSTKKFTAGFTSGASLTE